MTKLHPYLNFAGNAEQAFTFYRSVFGGEFSSLVRFRDFPMEGVTIPKEDEDKIMHVSLPIGQVSVLMASDALPSLGQQLVEGNNAYISVHPETREEADRLFNGLSVVPASSAEGPSPDATPCSIPVNHRALPVVPGQLAPKDGPAA